MQIIKDGKLIAQFPITRLIGAVGRNSEDFHANLVYTFSFVLVESTDIKDVPQSTSVAHFTNLGYY